MSYPILHFSPLSLSLSLISSHSSSLPSYIRQSKQKIEISCCANLNLNAPKWPALLAELAASLPFTPFRPPTSPTCGGNLNLSFSASIRCSELSGITTTKAECIFVYVKDKQMNKVDFPTRPQALENATPWRHSRGGWRSGRAGWRVAPAGHYLHNNYAAQCCCL